MVAHAEEMVAAEEQHGSSKSTVWPAALGWRRTGKARRQRGLRPRRPGPKCTERIPCIVADATDATDAQALRELQPEPELQEQQRPQHGLPAQSEVQALAADDAVQDSEQHSCTKAVLPAAPQMADEQVSTSSRRTRRVHFDSEANTQHSIQPYSEIYGLHPRLFDFDRNFWMVPATGFPNRAAMSGEEVDEDSDSDSEDGEWEEWLPSEAAAVSASC